MILHCVTDDAGQQLPVLAWQECRYLDNSWKCEMKASAVIQQIVGNFPKEMIKDV
jgi:hypothetical protein